MRRDTLLIIPALRARRGENGAFHLTVKFVDGVNAYARRWPGPVRVAVYPTGRHDGNLDGVSVHPGAVPFELRWADDPTLGPLHENVAVALVSVVDRLLPVIDGLIDRELPTVLVSEYALRTRNRIVKAETGNPIIRLRRTLYNYQLENRFRHAARRAAGLQCNGTPTYDSWGPLNRSPLLYFDSRIMPAMVAADGPLHRRTSAMRRGGPLRLAFSGRWTAMKGTDHLIDVAAELRRLKVRFNLDVCGGGVLEPAMRRAISRSGLGGTVRLRGLLDFRTELIPFMSDSVDLFVCCHRQGDPSCTYLETMACGTPIAGYDNEAFAGIAGHAGVGWTTPMDDPGALAARIAELDADRSSLASAAVRSRDFALQHTFDQTVRRRIDHLLACAGARRSGAAA